MWRDQALVLWKMVKKRKDAVFFDFRPIIPGVTCFMLFWIGLHGTHLIIMV